MLSFCGAQERGQGKLGFLKLRFRGGVRLARRAPFLFIAILTYTFFSDK
jgi:hypothetical protein